MKTELQILKDTVQYYADNGYSRAVKALKEIEQLNAPPKKLSLRTSFWMFLADWKASRGK